MTRNTFLRNLSQSLQLTQGDLSVILREAHHQIIAATIETGKVRFPGFGTFHLKHTKARLGRNPKDPTKRYSVPARRILAFRPAEKTIEALQQKSHSAIRNHRIVPSCRS
jgi:nucleoid DNA-binding protein